MQRVLYSCAVLLVAVTPALADDFERGREALRAKDWELAVACFTAAIRENPTEKAAYYDRALAYQGLNQPRKAIVDYTESIRLDANYTVAYNNRGNCYYDLEDYEKAIKDFSQAIRIDPK